MREHGQNTDNSRTVGEQVALRSMHRSLKNLEKNGGPPETRTPDPLIKSASPNGPQPRHYQNSQAFQRKASFCLEGVGIWLHQDTDKRRTFSGGDAFPPTPVIWPVLKLSASLTLLDGRP